MIKVLVVVTQMNVGGIESRLMDILRCLDYSRIQIDIYTCRQETGVFDDEARELGSIIYYNKPLTVKNMFSYVKYFSAFLVKHPEYRIIHAHMDEWCSVFCKGAYNAGVPIRIAHSRTAIPMSSISNIAKNMVKLPVVKFATHYFSVSDKAGIWLFGKRNFAKGRVRVWKNAIDCNKYRYDPKVRNEVRQELGIDENCFVIMHVGNFVRGKNHPFLVDVMKEVKRSVENCLLILVGNYDMDISYYKYIQEKIEKAGLNNYVKFLGSRRDVYRVLQAGDVYMLPSVFEGFPGSLLEAQASGMPCLMSDTVTKDAIVLSSTKVLSLNEPLEEWAGEIIKFENFNRRDTYQDLVRQGFDISSMVKDLMKFYEEQYRFV